MSEATPEPGSQDAETTPIDRFLEAFRGACRIWESDKAGWEAGLSEAESIAREVDIPSGLALVESERLIRDDNADEAISRLQTLEEHTDGRIQGEIHVRFGNAYYVKQELDRAIECYQAALDTPGYDTSGKAHNNMGIAYRVKGELDRAIESSQAALDTPGYDMPGDAHINMGIAYREKRDFDRAIECFQAALDTPGYDTPGHAHIHMGIVYYDKRDLDRAIECYQAALIAPGYNTHGSAHNNMGIAYREKGEFDRAIACYQAALDRPEYDAPGKARFSIGNAYYDKGEFDRAIEYYQAALDTPGFDTPGDAHINMGNAYDEKEEFDRAIACYQAALDTPGYDTPGDAQFNMGLTYEEAGNIQKAKEAYQAAVLEYEKASETMKVVRTKRSLSLLGSDEGELSEEGKAVARRTTDKTDPDSPEQRVVELIDRAGGEENDIYFRYQQRARKILDKTRENRERFDEAYVLRDWGSTTPLAPLEDPTVELRGGGYAFRWRGKVIVIDPGHNFLLNYYQSGLQLLEVSAVLVTHNHGDHNQDLKPLDDMIYELHRPRGSSNGVEGEADHNDPNEALEDTYQYVLVWDQDTARELSGSMGPSRHRVTLTFDAERLNQGMECTLDIKKPEPLPVRIKYFKAQHTRDVPAAVGLRMTFLDDQGKDALVVGHTADTQYFPELADEHHLGGCRLLFAHISQPFHKEYADAWLPTAQREPGYYRRGHDETGYFKGGHLGLRGTIEIIRDLKPELVIIGEFWPGIADLRIALTRVIQERAKIDGKLHSVILPGSRSLRLRMPDLNVVCTACDEAVPAGRIQVAPSEHKFGKLGYICHRCRS